MNKKYKAMSWAGVAVAVALLVLVNVFMSVLAEKTQIKIDLTSNKRYELTDRTLTPGRYLTAMRRRTAI